MGKSSSGRPRAGSETTLPSENVEIANATPPLPLVASLAVVTITLMSTTTQPLPLRVPLGPTMPLHLQRSHHPLIPRKTARADTTSETAMAMRAVLETIKLQNPAPVEAISNLMARKTGLEEKMDVIAKNPVGLIGQAMETILVP